jgi:hypothetical protein
MINAIRNKKMEMRLIPCMYFIHCVCGALGSLFLMKRYSAICRKTPISKLFPL